MEKKPIIITKKIDTAVLKGVVIVHALSYPERIEESKKSVGTTKDGEGSIEFALTQNLDRSKDYYDLACRQIKNVDVKVIDEESGTEITHATDVESLVVYEEGITFIMEIATSLIQGITLGKKKAQDLDKIV